MKRISIATLYSTWLETPLGNMLAIADEKVLYFLEFDDGYGLKQEMLALQKKINPKIKSNIIHNKETNAVARSKGANTVTPIQSIKKELTQYFNGKLTVFKTPLSCFGTDFQKNVWRSLQKIPFGETRSYAEMAKAIKMPTAFRAVANANGANRMAIVIPCHRVINSNGGIGGYAGGVSRKKWLLRHEGNIL